MQSFPYKYFLRHFSYQIILCHAHMRAHTTKRRYKKKGKHACSVNNCIEVSRAGWSKRIEKTIRLGKFACFDRSVVCTFFCSLYFIRHRLTLSINWLNLYRSSVFSAAAVAAASMLKSFAFPSFDNYLHHLRYNMEIFKKPKHRNDSSTLSFCLFEGR